MNLFGKIFTLLIFFMSVTFIVLAVMVGASHRNWKEIANTNKLQATNTANRLAAVKTASNEAAKKLNAEQVARQQQLSQLFSELQIAKTRLESATKENRDLTERNAQLAANLNVSNTRLVAQDDEVEKLKQLNNSLVDDIAAQRQSVLNLTNEQYRLQGRLEALKEENESKNGLLARQLRVMKANGLTENSLTDDIPRKLEGLVTGSDSGFIAISLGTDDGLREGHEIDVYRGIGRHKYVGRAVVTTTQHDKAAARLLPEFTQTAVREGDYVTTKL